MAVCAAGVRAGTPCKALGERYMKTGVPLAGLPISAAASSIHRCGRDCSLSGPPAAAGAPSHSSVLPAARAAG